MAVRRDSEMARLPLYVQLRDQLSAQIASGNLGAGTRLPGIRQLAASLQINPNTVYQALRELQTEGYVQLRQGEGAFVLDPPRAAPSPQALLTFHGLVEDLFARCRALGVEAAEVADCVAAYARRLEAGPELRGIFVECNLPTARRYAEDLTAKLGVPFEVLLIQDLEANGAACAAKLQTADLVVTVAIHRPQLDALLAAHVRRPVNTYSLAMGQLFNLTVRLGKLPRATSVGCICVTAAGVQAMEASIRPALPPDCTFHGAWLDEGGEGAWLEEGGEGAWLDENGEERVAEVLKRARVLVLSALVRERLGKRLPWQTQIIPYDNRLDDAGVDMLQQAIANLRRHRAYSQLRPGAAAERA